MRTRPARRPTAAPWTHLFTARSTTSGWWPAPEPPRTFFDWRTHLKIGKATVPRSAICTSNENTIVVRGADLAHELIGQINFGDYFFLLVTGRRADAATSAVLNATLVAIAEHGLVPSVQAARMTLAAAPDAMQGAVADRKSTRLNSSH